MSSCRSNGYGDFEKEGGGLTATVVFLAASVSVSRRPSLRKHVLRRARGSSVEHYLYRGLNRIDAPKTFF